MVHVNDLSRSVVAFEQSSTLIAVILEEFRRDMARLALVRDALNSRRFGLASAPTIPQTVQTIRGRKAPDQNRIGPVIGRSTPHSGTVRR